jgi:hypothetical protein
MEVENARELRHSQLDSEEMKVRRAGEKDGGDRGHEGPLTKSVPHGGELTRRCFPSFARWSSFCTSSASSGMSFWLASIPANELLATVHERAYALQLWGKSDICESRNA